MKIYILSREYNDYEASSSLPIRAFLSREKAYALAEKYNAEKTLEEKLDNLRKEFSYNSDNFKDIYAVWHDHEKEPIRPVFDKNRKNDKHYHKQHMVAVAEYNKAYSKWHREVFAPKQKAYHDVRLERIDAYMDSIDKEALDKQVEKRNMSDNTSFTVFELEIEE